MTLADALALEAIGQGFVRIRLGRLFWEPTSLGHATQLLRQLRQPPRRAGTAGTRGKLRPIRSIGVRR